MQTQRAFTFIEMLTVISLILIFALIALPSLQILKDHHEDQLLQTQLLQALHFAKLEAVSGETTIAMCGTQDQRTCSNTAANTWLIFRNAEEDGRVHEPADILKVVQLPAHGTIYWHAFPWYRHYLLFFPLIRMTNDNGTYWYCNNTVRWAISLNKAGFTRIILPDKHGRVRDPEGRVLSCLQG